MDNKLSELSKPVAWKLHHHDRYYFEENADVVAIAESVGKAKGDAVYSQEYVSALLEKLNEKGERAIACVNAFEGIETDRIAGKSLGEFLAGELYLNKAEPKQDGSFGFTFSGLAVQLMADCFADQFKSSGAINYLELLFEHAEVGEMTVTMQRVEGLTPAQKLAAAEQRIAELEEDRRQLNLIINSEANRADAAEKRVAELSELETQVKVWESAATKHLARAEEAEKRLATPVRLPDTLAGIGEKLRTQDNRITSEPMFCVYQKREIVADAEYDHDRIVWVDADGLEASEHRRMRLELLHDNCREVPAKWRRVAVKEIDEFVTCCFTEQGCKDYLACNGHNLRLPFIYVNSGFRNAEYIALRKWLMATGFTVEGDE